MRDREAVMCERIDELKVENARLKSAHGHMQQEIAMLRSREMCIDDISDYVVSFDRLKAQNAKLRDHLESLVNSLTVLIQESNGVSGLHRNGDVATWGELTEGGRFEDWLVAYNDGCRLIAALEAE